MRIHLGHHFYGAGNLGDDFMLAGFLLAMGELLPAAGFTGCVPFELGPLRQRFPQVKWLPYTEADRREAIAACDVWLGLGGSPFQSALSRWFVDHLTSDAALCAIHRRPMFFLGVGVQSAEELTVPETHRICSGAAAIWTRDAVSAERIAALSSPPSIAAGSDLAHIFFRSAGLPRAAIGRLTLVPNFDYSGWPGRDACLDALGSRGFAEFVWLAQESRDLPGAERALFAALPERERLRWRLVSPELPGASLAVVMSNWPSAEYLVTARYHSALAGAWSGSHVVVIATNEKLRAAARELDAPQVSVDASRASVMDALDSARMGSPPQALADAAFTACAAFARSAVAHCR